MKRNSLFIILLLALFTGQAEAQRRLPGMKAVRFTTEMADGFYSRANRHDAGYAFSLAVSTCTGNGNQWMFGGEMLKRNIPYRSTHIPLSQYTGKAVITIRSFPPRQVLLPEPRRFRPVGL